MRNYTPEEIAKIKAGLPEDLKQALSSVDMMQELRVIVAEDKLHIDQAGAVADVVELTLSGLVRTREFITTLQEVLPGMSHDQVVGLAEQINKRIFSRVQASLRKIDREEMQASGESIMIPELPPTPTPKQEKAPISATPTIPQKLSLPASIPAVKTDISHVNLDPRVKMIPEDIKQKINSDPYKEPIT